MTKLKRIDLRYQTCAQANSQFINIISFYLLKTIIYTVARIAQTSCVLD